MPSRARRAAGWTIAVLILSGGTVLIISGGTAAAEEVDVQRAAHLTVAAPAGAFSYRPYAVSLGGDFNGDGRNDVLVSAPHETPEAVYVVFGRAGRTTVSLPAAADDGLRISGAGAFGMKAVSVGDLDGDGLDDVLVGPRRLELGGTPAVGTAALVASSTSYVVYGRPGGGALDLDAVGVDGASVGARELRVTDASAYVAGQRTLLGAELASGDFNGDGDGDLALFDSGRDRVHVLFGDGTRRTDRLEIGAAVGTALAPGFTFIPSPNRYFGPLTLPTGAGDLTGDGIDDVVVGQPWAGAVFVLPGGDDMTTRTGPLVREGTGGFVLTGDENHRFGEALAIPGDMDGDGADDLAVSIPRQPTGGIGEGVVRILHGPVTPAASSSSSVLATPDGFRAGYYLAAAGDADGDGLADLLISGRDYGRSDGSLAWRVNGANDRADVVLDADLGERGTLFRIPGGVQSPLGAGTDVTGDGRPDVVLNGFVEVAGDYRTAAFVVGRNAAPDCAGLGLSTATLAVRDGSFVPVAITGTATDPEGDAVTTRVTAVTQDEVVGATAPDALLLDDGGASLRAERDGGGDGRVYRLTLTATDALGASCDRTATVGVPHDGSGRPLVDSGGAFDSLVAGG